MKSARWFVLFGICLALIACQAVDHHSGATGHQPAADDDADDDSIVDDDCASPHQFLYELSPGKRDIPFPSDLFTRADMSSSTGRRVEMDGQTTLFLDRLLDVFGFLRSALDRLEGFGVTTPVMLPADSEPDMATLPGAADPGPQDSVFLVRFDDSGAPLEYAPLVFEWRQTQQVLVARPYLALLQNTTYALVVTDALKPADGTCYEPAEDFRYVRAGRPDATHPGYALLEPYRRQFASLFDFLENRAGVPRERVLVATVFTTQNVTPELESIRDQLKVRAAKEPPTARNWTYVGTGTDLDSIWEFDYDTVNWQWDGELHHDVRCRPVSNGKSTIKGRVVLPDPSRFPQPWPVVIYMHGLNADRTEADGIGEGLAAYGFAVFSFDLIYHGERGPNSDTLRLLEFFNFFEPFKWRANFQQDVSDEMWLTHLVRNLGDLDLAPYSTGGDGVPDLDLSHIVFMGHSLGAIHGGIVAAVDDAQSVFVYNSAAADYRALAMQSPTGESILEVVQALDGDLDWDAYSRAMMIIDLLLAVVELGDPMAYAPYVFDHPLPKMTVPRQMLFEMAAYDSSLGAAACGRFATVLGLTQLEPVVWRLPDTPLGQTPFAGPAVYQYDTDVHGFWWEIDQPHLQAGHFLDTWRDTGFGEIIDPYQP